MIPASINICGIPYNIVFGKNDYDPHDQFGQICYTKAEIVINPESPDELQMQTLIHEWVHGALVLSGHNKESEDELLVNSLALAINRTFQIKDDIIRTCKR